MYVLYVSTCSCSWVHINFSGDLLYHIYMMSFTSYGMSEHAKVIMNCQLRIAIFK